MFPTYDILAAYVFCFYHPLHMNSFCWLSSGIVPSNKTTYPLSQIQTALKAQTGSLPYVGCGSNGTVLQEVWYYNHVLGTVSDTSCPSFFTIDGLPTIAIAQEQFGQFKSLDTTYNSTCSATAGIHYYERTPTSEREVR